MRFSAVATDLEFIKTGGRVLARSAAFVPFTARSRLSLCAVTGHSSVRHGDDTSTAESLQCDSAPCCHFPVPPVVLSLPTAEVLRLADVLPCGHALMPHVTRALVAGDALEALKAVHTSEAEDAWAAFRLLQRDLRAQQRVSKSLATSDAHSTGSVLTDEQDEDAATNPHAEDGPAHHDTPAPSRVVHATHTLSPQEVALRRQLQMRVAIPRFFEILDPHGIPNVSRVSVAACRALYTEDASSSAFIRASQSLSDLRAYGRGKGKQKSLAFLLRYHPEFLQDVLRRSFADSEAWLTFLRDCRDVSQRELERVQEAHRADSVGTPGTSDFANAFRYVEAGTLDALSTELNRTWATFLYGQQRGQASAGNRHGSKFFAYGATDGPVLHATLETSCARFHVQHLSQRATAAGRVGDRRGRERFRARDTTTASLPSASVESMPLSPVPREALISPFQAKLLDVTQHTLFRASGLLSAPKKVPPLATALERLITKDPTAAAVHTRQQPHDPLWDAQALACVCVGCGVVR